MSNMSYCRFNNTVIDLRDCEESLESLRGLEESLSPEELAKASQLVCICASIVNSVLADLGIEHDAEKALEAISKMANGDREEVAAMLEVLNEEADEYSDE